MLLLASALDFFAKQIMHRSPECFFRCRLQAYFPVCRISRQKQAIGIHVIWLSPVSFITIIQPHSTSQDQVNQLAAVAEV